MKPFVKRQKNDAADADAIAEAASRPTMRFVAVKSEAQQAAGMAYRTRDLLVRQRTQTINALRGHLAEYGVVAPTGIAHIGRLEALVEGDEGALPAPVTELARVLLTQIAEMTVRIEALDAQIRRRANDDPAVERLMTIPRVGAGDLRQRSGLRRMGRAHPAAAFDRRQGEAWEDHPHGPTRHPTAADHRRGRRRPMGGAQGRARGHLARAHAGEEAAHAGHGRAGQPDGARRVGGHAQGGGLPGSGGHRGLTATIVGMTSEV